MRNKTIAIVGAGPGIGLAVAEKFGGEGFQVALIARNRDRLDVLADGLRQAGIPTATFTADVTDILTVTAALEQAIAHFGSVDVLEYSPVQPPESIRVPSQTKVDDLQYQLDLMVLGAVAAVQAVLPGMIERQSGSILITAPASAQYPVVMTGNTGVAGGAALNYARLLNQELAPQGIYAGFVGVAGFVVPKGEEKAIHPSGFPLLTAQDVAQVHWKLHSTRDKAVDFAGDPGPLRAAVDSAI